MMEKKACIRCDEIKDLSEFHRSKRFKDGRIARCKVCEARIYQESKEKVSARQKKRWATWSVEQAEKLKEKSRRYRASHPEQVAEQHARWLLENKPKRDAQAAAQRAIRMGSIKRQSCEICGSPETHAHHDDYARPLDVRFLCQRHHSAWHVEHGEAPNGKTEVLEIEETI
jgi:hypothetical protein